MSEYQNYEFAAIDGPISDEGMRYARGCSTRASVSRMRWQNTYTFGDFHGSVETLLKYYDAHFYIANWGSVRLGLALPNGALPTEAVQPYLRKGRPYANTLKVKEIGDRCVVWWDRNLEEGWTLLRSKCTAMSEYQYYELSRLVSGMAGGFQSGGIW